jgi:hypothetical protein
VLGVVVEIWDGIGDLGQERDGVQRHREGDESSERETP